MHKKLVRGQFETKTKEKVPCNHKKKAEEAILPDKVYSKAENFVRDKRVHFLW